MPAEDTTMAQVGDSHHELARSFARCLSGTDGERVLLHLERLFLLRRCPPSATDAELRHVEGQRSVVAHIAAMIERGRR